MVTIRLRDGTALGVTLLANDKGDEERIIYRWPTPFTPREFLKRCVPLQKREALREQVEVVTFPSDQALRGERGSGAPLEVVSYHRFLEDGGPFGDDLSTVRFNADSVRLGPFSLIWTRLGSQDPSVQGEIQAMFRKTPDMMDDMIAASISERGKRFVRRLLRAGREFQQ